LQVYYALGKAGIKRQEERSFVLQVLYACEFNKDPWQVLLTRIAEEQQMPVTAYVEQMILLSQEHKLEIDEEIKIKLKNWDYHRVAVIDRIILHMALVELLYYEDIPPEVTMNEAIELAKKFSTEQSNRFINGLIDAIYKKLKREGRIIKSGRGLISRITE
jgi:N utilization substance protein B